MNPIVMIIVLILLLIIVSVFVANYFGIINIFPAWSAIGISNTPPPPPSDTSSELPPAAPK
jgi:hypothetical protein